MAMATDIGSDVEALRAEVAALRSVCAQAYQLAGAAGAPTRALDVLAAAAAGDALPHGGEFLPVAPDDFDEVRALRDALLTHVAHTHADADERVDAAALRAVADDVEVFDAPLAHHLRATSQTFQPRPYDEVVDLVEAWMRDR